MRAFTTRPELQGSFGMVASTHWLASAVGMAQLEAGGNAFDAAVAAGFTLQVAEPHLNGPGGDMTLLLAEAERPPEVLCGQGPAPAAATSAAMGERGLDRVPGTGVAAAAIPASTLAWLILLRDRGTRSLADVLEPAIHYAERGVPVLPTIRHAIAGVAGLFTEHWPSSAQVYLRAGAAPAVGERLTNPTLAETYRRLAAAASGRTREAAIDAAVAAWREGFVAEAVDRHCAAEHADGLGGRYAGLITGADLAAYLPDYEPPVTGPHGDWQVVKAGAWSQGPVLLQHLALLSGIESLTPGSAEWIHLVIETAKLAYADRDAWYGDPARSAEVPLEALLTPEYAEARRALVTDRADLSLRPGAPAGHPPRLPTWTPVAEGSDGIGEPTVASDVRGDTCHVSVADRWGNLVAATPSGGWLQSSPVVPELGFPLGTRLQMTTLEPGLPATLRPGGRPRTTLTPSLALHGDGRRMAFGTPGGDQQDQWQAAFWLQHTVAGLDLQAAIDAPAFHSEHFPSSFYPREAFPGRVIVEERVGAGVVAELRRRGHEVLVADPWRLGRLSAVSATPEPGGFLLKGAANPRGMQGYAVGR